jgi:hypothetical protein
MWQRPTVEISASLTISFDPWIVSCFWMRTTRTNAVVHTTMPSRRAVLRALPVATLGGCASAPVDTDTESPTDTHSATHSDSPTDLRATPAATEITARMENDGVDPVEFESTMVTQMSRDSPAIVEISALNTGDTSREAQFGAAPPFSKIWVRTDTNGVILLPETKRDHVNGFGCDDAAPDEPDPCWQANCQIAVDALSQTRVIEPGDDITTRYLVLEDSMSNGCFLPGTYESIQEYPELGGEVTLTLELS